MLALLDSGLDMSNMITHRLPARDWQQAFDLMETRKAGKVILDWSDI
jgi:threonine 3-dehydrogenase